MGEVTVHRLAVVERNEVSRLGRAAVARRALGTRWDVVAVEPDDVGSVLDARVILVVIAADGDGFDRYDTVAALSAHLGPRSSARPRIVATTLHHNPLLDIRLAQAGVDAVVPVRAVSRSDDGRLAAVVTAAITGRRESVGEPAGRAASDLAGTDPEAVLAYVVERGLEGAFDPGLAQHEVGLSRRTILRVRQDLAELGGIRPSLARYTGGADRRIELPTWREVVAYVNCARGEVDWGDDAWGNGPGPRIGSARHGVDDLVAVARTLVA